MMQLSREERMLQVESMTNIRDLGGYETQSGYYTKSHKFIRSTNPSKLTDEEKEYLYNYGIRLQIDLRSDFEIEQQPSSLIGYMIVTIQDCGGIVKWAGETLTFRLRCCRGRSA